MEKDYKLLKWISKNIKMHELIANEFTWVTQYLLAFSLKNMTSNFFAISTRNSYNYIRALMLQKALIYKNITLLYNLCKKYNISYIFITNELGYYDIAKQRYKYLSLYEKNKIIKILDVSYFLKSKIVYDLGRIYKVKG